MAERGEQRPLTGLQLWREFNRYYTRVSPIPANQNKMQKLRRKQAVLRSWKRIAKNNRANHVQLKRRFFEAINRSDQSNTHADGSTANYLAVHNNAHMSADAKANSAQDVLRARMQHLRNMDGLVQLEETIGAEAVDTMLTHDQDRRVQLRASVNQAVRMVSQWRQSAVAGLSDLQRLNILGARRQTFLRSHFGQDPNDRFVAIGGGNSDTQLGLWVQGNAQGNIIDRTVIKDVWFDQNAGAWEDPIYWQNVGDPLSKVLCEARIMARLGATQQPDDVVRLRSWNLQVVHLLFRMHMEYCPFGDTNAILDYHRALDQHIPEPLIWRIFESLVNAGLLMQQGHLTVPQANWLPIIHCDIKPENVFCGLHPGPRPARDNWAIYPLIKLGDYGLAIETIDTDPRNGTAFASNGTEGFMAPEQIATDRLTAKTNVYGAGITIMQLMSRHGSVGPSDEWQGALDGYNRPDRPKFSDSAADEYTDELTKLVEECVEFDPDDRPTFHTLRDSIRSSTGLGGPGDTDLALGMRGRVAPLALLTLGLRQDIWAVGNRI